MKDLSKYDHAAADYYLKSGLKTIPLMSWEFQQQFINDLQTTRSDAERLKKLAKAFRWKSNWDYESELMQQCTIIVTDAALSIVFASKNMAKMNGYKETEILGKSPKMFQGKDTDLQVSKAIREAISNQQPFEKTILNYRKNGTTYDCHVLGFPVFNNEGKLSHFIAFEKAA